MALDPKAFEEASDAPPAEPHDRLSFIRPRERQMNAHKRRSLIVAKLRVALPLGALLVLVTLVVLPLIKDGGIKAVAFKNIPDLVIKDLHFTGLDTKNEPYSLTAVKTTRPGGLSNIYDLDEPQGEITLANGAWVAGKAKTGRFDQDTHKLWLGGDVQLYHDKGYQFTTEEAQVDLTDNNAWGKKPVLIQGDFGQIRGQGFKLIDSGNVMVVTGPAHASLDLHKMGPSDKPARAAK
jgi:lipopolysaccharide export system protein LptC